MPARTPATTAAGLGLAALLALAALAACGDDGDAGPGVAAASAEGGARLEVLASFYPLQYVVERVGGPRVEVRNLTPPGVEPHDLELTPRDLGALEQADLVVYLGGFSPAVDDAVAAQAGEHRFDVTPAAGLDLTLAADEEHDDDGHGDAGHDDAHEDSGVDPHFWLDPTRLGAVADAVAARLATIDADGAARYAEGAAALRADLDVLDGAWRDGVRDCASRDLVTSHTAFGYLADRYGFHQVGISGLSPEEEPTPADLAAVARFVADHDVTTIYYETLVSPDVAETVAAETGAATAVLDPLEGLEEGADGDYLGVQRQNLATLRAGQRCA